MPPPSTADTPVSAGTLRSPGVAAGSAGQHQVLGAAVPSLVVDRDAVALVKDRVARQVTDFRKASPMVGVDTVEQRARNWINEAVAEWSDAAAAERGVSPTAAEDAALRRAVFDELFRAGRLQQHLDNPQVENVFINGHDEVWLDLAGGQRVRAERVADSEEELRELLRRLASGDGGQSERTLTTASPMLALRLADGSRLQAVTEVSPRTYVTIRRHRVQDADLEEMMRLGMVSPTLSAFLSACVKAEKNVLIAGPQAAGKTSLMRAMLKEIGPDERFATIETEFELYAHKNGFHRQVVPMEARESNGERGPDGRLIGEITLMDLMYRALRMSLSRIVVGEVRGPEIVAMLQAMTNGQGGNLCTLHASDPGVVFDRIAELYLLAQGNMSEQLAYRQAANGLDFIVFVRMLDESKIGGQRHRFVSHVLEVTGVGEYGRPATNAIFTPGEEFGEVRAVPRMPPSCLADLRRVGFQDHLLNGAYDSWAGQPLSLKVATA
ncbi:CpaF family protein [Streptomyces sp. NA02950]|uniref:CpaF family protein n=1 Tax=Streptomyces sp. NA02950 TaxID=2742137 RepID=UPI001591E54A|nr:CpaF family protein [Streptomyces sp. NA02950]QKV97262.1 CpaF family protein [Streptomyces sp. NA02950]